MPLYSMKKIVQKDREVAKKIDEIPGLEGIPKVVLEVAAQTITAWFKKQKLVPTPKPSKPLFDILCYRQSKIIEVSTKYVVRITTKLL